MSTALRTIDKAPSVAIATGDSLPDMSFPDMLALAEHLVASGFLPDYIKKPAQAVAIILAGREMGMPPMRSLRSLQMVKGKITESADSQLGRFKAAGGRAQFKVLDGVAAELYLQHPNGDTHTERFTLDDAKSAGLAGPQSMYSKYPKAMLRSRVITAGLKSIGWDGGAGVYDPSELAMESASDDSATSAATAEVVTLQERIDTAIDAIDPAGALDIRVGKDKKTLGSMSREGVDEVRKWAFGKATEAEAQGADNARLVGIIAACDLIVREGLVKPSERRAAKAAEKAAAQAEPTPEPVAAGAATATATATEDDGLPF